MAPAPDAMTLTAHLAEQVGARTRDLVNETSPEIAATILASFLRRLPDSAQAVATAAQANDLDNVAFNAHSLRGAASNIGATVLFERCTEVELAAKAGTVPTAEQLSEFSALVDSTAEAVGQVSRTIQVS